MALKLPRLYAIADRETLDGRGVSVAAFARELLEAGVRLVQYRDKVGAPQEVLRGAREVAEVFAGVEAMLVLNDRADLAALLGWGVHVGQGDLPVGDAIGIVRPHPSYKADGWGTRVVGVSTHTVEQVVAADREVALQPMSQKRDMGHPDCAGYVAIGPVFATSTKADAEPVVGLEGVRRARALTTKPLVAIGGITLENCQSVIEAGADSVVVISGLFVPGRTVREVAEDFLARMR
jgi:thiamine-phosphate pyrophosphorylase